ncbi:hypothetical protein A2767_01935 [Candidatus Roizmanbacteria bacterium RIFCSPHIGHO2_01_FULL_35_10]|uniref:Addiction module toxin RelE n=1 Tax=Candidatus Roizmanbacteria bacterium RIFCSPLOWO2_01_FULL_35_13 TaxID=1802055 RepID=A0A1F7I7H3_9BACT|nr:MAG: hypothetical protein A2767_01935 [Candidatus Roizmanbacteria bacterium RIFCSPHIGHO2_01_FULL_35_10]OGK39222.1 MAG: hypothetical protein A3A74_07355 [Candidatus Roizmanbacteria bacterium RIFCSPLOWO2_01_FULL_35_13]
MYSYFFKAKALKELIKLPKDIQKRIVDKVDFFVDSNKPLFFAENLVNYEIGQYRFRIEPISKLGISY